MAECVPHCNSCKSTFIYQEKPITKHLEIMFFFAGPSSPSVANPRLRRKKVTVKKKLKNHATLQADGSLLVVKNRHLQ